MTGNPSFAIVDIPAEQKTIEVDFFDGDQSTRLNLPLPIEIETESELREHILKYWPHQFFAHGKRATAERRDRFLNIRQKRIVADLEGTLEQNLLALDQYVPAHYIFNKGCGLHDHVHIYSHDCVVDEGMVIAIVEGGEPTMLQPGSPPFILPANVHHALYAAMDGTRFTNTRLG